MPAKKINPDIDSQKLTSTINRLEKQIYQIQQSTRTFFPFMIPIHDNLRMNYPAYYRWHLHGYSNFLHWIALALAISLLIILIISVISL